MPDRKAAAPCAPKAARVVHHRAQIVRRVTPQRARHNFRRVSTTAKMLVPRLRTPVRIAAHEMPATLATQATRTEIDLSVCDDDECFRSSSHAFESLIERLRIERSEVFVEEKKIGFLQ